MNRVRTPTAASALLAVLAVLCMGGVVTVVLVRSGGDGATDQPATATGRAEVPHATSSGVGSSTSVSGPEVAVGMAPPALRPVRLAVPAIGVDAAMTDLGIATDGSIEVPAVPAQAGWLDTTPAPGQRGPSVIAGHVDSDSGPAVFYRLSSLRPGDRIVVTRADGSSVTFSVDDVRVYPQRQFPTTAVYGPVPGPVLRLITCGGDYDRARGGYQDNVVVYAS